MWCYRLALTKRSTIAPPAAFGNPITSESHPGSTAGGSPSGPPGARRCLLGSRSSHWRCALPKGAYSRPVMGFASPPISFGSSAPSCSAISIFFELQPELLSLLSSVLYEL
jgi:hypothetical protein